MSAESQVTEKLHSAGEAYMDGWWDAERLEAMPGPTVQYTCAYYGPDLSQGDVRRYVPVR